MQPEDMDAVEKLELLAVFELTCVYFTTTHSVIEDLFTPSFAVLLSSYLFDAINSPSSIYKRTDAEPAQNSYMKK